MTKTVFLHIGAHKTGTTMLQYSANRHRAALRSQGVDYPRLCWSGIAHHELPVALVGRASTRMPNMRGRDTVLADLVAGIHASPCPRVLISSEALFKTPQACLLPLAEALAPFDTRILVTLRRPDDLYLSGYTQRSKDPYDRFAAELCAHLDHPWIVTPDCRIFTHVSAWHAAFGAEAMQVSIYEEGAPVKRVLSAIGADIPCVDTRVARNAAQSSHLCEVMLWAKRRGLPLGARRALYSAGVRLLRGGTRYRLSPEDRARILRAALPETEPGFALLGRPNPYRPEGIDDQL